MQQHPQQQQQQVFSIPGVQYGGAAGAVFGHGAMRPPSTSGFPYHAAFPHGTQVPSPAQAGLYTSQQAFGQSQAVPTTQAQGQMYSQQYGQPGLGTTANAQSLGGSQEQGPINPSGSSNLRTGAAEPMYTSGSSTAPGLCPSSQEQAQPPHMQYGGVEGAQGRGDGSRERP